MILYHGTKSGLNGIIQSKVMNQKSKQYRQSKNNLVYFTDSISTALTYTNYYSQSIQLVRIELRRFSLLRLLFRKSKKSGGGFCITQFTYRGVLKLKRCGIKSAEVLDISKNNETSTILNLFTAVPLNQVVLDDFVASSNSWTKIV